MSPKIANIAGIDIQLHWTFILLLLIALIAGIGTFVIIILLFVFVVMHELSHSIVSLKHYKIPVKKIILFPLGGASIIDLENVKPEQGLWIAFAGPLLSIALSGLFGLAWLYSSGPLSDLLLFSAEINLLLGIFNLLPAFPLDGGRVLKSYLEERSDDLSATKKAVTISKYIIIIFIAGTVAYTVYLTNLSVYDIEISLLWDLLIVFFIYTAGQAELQSAYIKKYTKHIKVSKVMGSNYILVKPSTTMIALYKLLLSRKTHIVIVRKGHNFALVSRIPINPLNQGTKEMLQKKVTEFAEEIPSVKESEPLSKAIEIIRYEDAPAVTVTRGGKLVGLLMSEHLETIIALHMPQIMGGK